jgi:hypothetical protein
MDKLEFEPSESLTPPPEANTGIPTLDAVCEHINMYMHHTTNKKDWEYGKMFGKDAVFDPKKIIEDVVNIVLDDIKCSDAYNDVMSVSNRKKIAQSINILISTYQSPAINLEDSKKITIKLLGYFLSLHVLQKSV